MRNTWQLQEAKNQFSLVVDNALSRGAQIITRHGEPTVVVISVAEYRKLLPPRKRIVDVLRACPVKDLDLRRVRELPRDRAL
jgi:antitoxin Phd